MCGPAALPIITAIAGVVGAGAALKSSIDSKKAAKKANATQEKANAEAKANSEAALAAQTKDNNRKNAKSPNVAAILQSNKQATTNQTLLSGPGGVDNSQLQLGKNTLLGN